jgi:hypothetical protein
MVLSDAEQASNGSKYRTTLVPLTCASKNMVLMPSKAA